MTLFWSIAALLTAAALLFLLPPLLRRRSAPPDARSAANAAIYREQLEELAADLQRGALGQEEFERQSREIGRRILAEHGRSGPQAAQHPPQLAAAVLIGVALPLAAGLGYWVLGQPRALQAESLAQAAPQELEAMIDRLAARLEKTPGDAEGWALLARSLATAGRYEHAAQAFARAAQLAPDDRELVVDFVKTLALAGRAEFESRNYAAAIGYWERLLPFAPPESEFSRAVAESIAEAKQLGGVSEARPEKSERKDKGKGAPGRALSGVVSLDPALAAKVSPGDTVFVVARPAEGGAGPRIPLAVARTTVARLPYRFTLDDSMAMAANVKLSDHARVVVVARVSRSGSAAAQKGDIEGVSATVAPGATGLKLVLSRVVE